MSPLYVTSIMSPTSGSCEALMCSIETTNLSEELNSSSPSSGSTIIVPFEISNTVPVIIYVSAAFFFLYDSEDLYAENTMIPAIAKTTTTPITNANFLFIAKHFRIKLELSVRSLPYYHITGQNTRTATAAQTTMTVNCLTNAPIFPEVFTASHRRFWDFRQQCG